MEAPTTVHFEVEHPLTKEQMSMVKQFISKLTKRPALEINISPTKLHEFPSIHVG